MTKKHLCLTCLMVILLGCAPPEESRRAYVNGLAILKAGDLTRYSRAIKDLYSIPQVYHPLEFIDLEDPHYFKSIRLADEIKADYASKKGSELRMKYANTRIAFVDDDQGRLYCMDFDGSNRRALNDDLWHCRVPRWSPDGASIAAESGGHIVVVRFPSGAYTQVTDG